MLTVIWIINLVFGVYEFLILVRVLLSWVNISPFHPLVRILYSLTDPLLKPLQRIIPPIGGALDISPAVALILLYIVQRVLVSLLIGIA
jgi:YggT family protein